MHSIHFIRGSLCCFTARHGSGGEAVVGTPQRLCAAGRALPRRPRHGKLQLSRTTSFSAVSIMLLSCQAGQQLHHTSSTAAGASCAAIAADCWRHRRTLQQMQGLLLLATAVASTTCASSCWPLTGA